MVISGVKCSFKQEFLQSTFLPVEFNLFCTLDSFMRRNYKRETLATYAGEETNSVYMHTLEMCTLQWKYLL